MDLTVDQIKARWEQIDAAVVPMLFTNHVKMDVLVLLDRIQELEDQVAAKSPVVPDLTPMEFCKCGNCPLCA